jgi:hypothetical protein
LNIKPLLNKFNVMGGGGGGGIIYIYPFGDLIQRNFHGIFYVLIDQGNF